MSDDADAVAVHDADVVGDTDVVVADDNIFSGDNTDVGSPVVAAAVDAFDSGVVAIVVVVVVVFSSMYLPPSINILGLSTGIHTSSFFGNPTKCIRACPSAISVMLPAKHCSSSSSSFPVFPLSRHNTLRSILTLLADNGLAKRHSSFCCCTSTSRFRRLDCRDDALPAAPFPT